MHTVNIRVSGDQELLLLQRDSTQSRVNIHSLTGIELNGLGVVLGFDVGDNKARSFTVSHPRECPWRMATSCSYKNGGYLNGIACGPFVKDFPHNCPLEVK